MDASRFSKFACIALLAVLVGCAGGANHAVAPPRKAVPAASPKPPISRETAIRIARAYANKEHPEIDFSQEPAKAEKMRSSYIGSTEYVHEGWIVDLGGHARKDPVTGRQVGRCGYYAKKVYIQFDGTVLPLESSFLLGF